MSAPEAKNAWHSEHAAFLSQQIELWQREKTSQNCFKGRRFNWPSPERFFTAVQRMKAEINLRLADYCHNFLKNELIVSLRWSFQNWRVALAAHYTLFVSIKSPVTVLHIFVCWVVPPWHWGDLQPGVKADHTLPYIHSLWPSSSPSSCFLIHMLARLSQS